jgi:CubicO group peptidase (beta-lactamase class C family)
MTPETPYFVASVTKLFVAAVVLRLVERGLVRLEDSFVTYLPSDIVDRLHVLDDVDRTADVTVRHLLAHASGLPDYLEDKPKAGPPFVERLLSEGDREVPLTEVAHIVRDELTPHFPPRDLDSGTRVRVRYSDTNFQLLMGIIEAVLGCPWSTALRMELLEPLELRHTWVPGSRPLEPTLEPAALWAGSDLFEAPRLLGSLGDLFSTVGDQLVFLRALLGGAVFRDPLTAERMSARWNAFGFDLGTPRLPGWPIEYGLGMMRFALPRWYTPFSPVPPVIGHTGSTGCWLFYCPQLDLYMCGGVDQITAGAVPFRVTPRVLRAASGLL